MKRLPLVQGRHMPDANGADEVVVDVAVTGAMDDAVALAFARTLAESMGATLWREGPRPDGRVVATGLVRTASARARVLHIVITGGVPRAAWRDPRLRCDLELADPRAEVALALGAHLASWGQEW